MDTNPSKSAIFRIQMFFFNLGDSLTEKSESSHSLLAVLARSCAKMHGLSRYFPAQRQNRDLATTSIAKSLYNG